VGWHTSALHAYCHHFNKHSDIMSVQGNVETIEEPSKPRAKPKPRQPKNPDAAAAAAGGSGPGRKRKQPEKAPEQEQQQQQQQQQQKKKQQQQDADAGAACGKKKRQRSETPASGAAAAAAQDKPPAGKKVRIVHGVFGWLQRYADCALNVLELHRLHGARDSSVHDILFTC
jgi:hypothetical protein